MHLIMFFFVSIDKEEPLDQQIYVKTSTYNCKLLNDRFYDNLKWNLLLLNSSLGDNGDEFFVLVGDFSFLSRQYLTFN